MDNDKGGMMLQTSRPEKINPYMKAEQAMDNG